MRLSIITGFLAYSIFMILGLYCMIHCAKSTEDLFVGAAVMSIYGLLGLSVFARVIA